MIKIIKKGNPEIALYIKYFKCPVCKCEWTGDKNDYKTSYGQRDAKEYSMDCPTCGARVFNMEPFQQDFEDGLIKEGNYDT